MFFRVCSPSDSQSRDSLLEILDDHVAEVDTDPELHAAVNRQVGVSLGEFLLDTDGALDGRHHAGKLGEEVIPW